MQNYNMPQYGPQMRAPYNYNAGMTQYYASAPQIRYVTSRNEAEATTPDINGAPTFFFNRGTNEIYLKQMDMLTALPIFKEFIEKPIETEMKPAISIDTLNAKLDEIKSLMEQGSKKKVVKDE